MDDLVQAQAGQGPVVGECEILTKREAAELEQTHAA